MKSKRPTLKTISELTGFAVPTVSRALQDAPDIAERTRQRIQQVAREIGYVPNREGVRLRTGRTNTISLVLPTHSDINEHPGRLVAAVAEALQGTDYQLLISPYPPRSDPMEPVRYVVETRLADAIIIHEIEDEDPRVAYMMEADFPFVTYGRTNWCDRHPYFDFDNVSFGELAGRTLCERGRRHLLLAAPPRSQAYSRHMIEGLENALAGTGTGFEILEGATSDGPQDEIRAALAARLARPGPTIDAVVSPSTGAAVAAVVIAEAAGRTIGRDFDVFAKESLPILGLFRPAIMTVAEDLAVVADFVVRAAIHALQHPEEPPMQRLERFHLPAALAAG